MRPFSDFKKAFLVVDHKNLLTQLKRYNCWKLLKSSSEDQTVLVTSYNRVLSKQTVSCGVP